MGWLKKNQPSRPTKPINYPDGLAVDTGEDVYYVKGTLLFKVYSPRVLRSWGFKPVLGSKVSVSTHRLGGVLGFRDGTLLRDFSDGKLYLVSGNKRRHIVSPDAFERYGLDRNDVLDVSHDEVNLHDEGEQLG